MLPTRKWVAGGVLVAALIGIAAAGTAFAISSDRAPSQVAPLKGKINVYSAPFACGLMPSGGVPLDPTEPQQGFPRELPLKPANYATDVNVHNPGASNVVLYKKAVLSGWVRGAVPGATGVQTSEPEQVFPGGSFRTLQLPPDGAFEVDCNDIATVLKPPGTPPGVTFIKGFVVIETQAVLDVQDVLTSERVGTTVVQCLMANGSVVSATPNAAGVLACPVDPAGAGPVSITSSNTGTGLTLEVVTITPDVISVGGPIPDTGSN